MKTLSKCKRVKGTRPHLLLLLKKTRLLSHVAPVLQLLPITIIIIMMHTCDRQHIHTTPLVSHLKIISSKPVRHEPAGDAFPIFKQRRLPRLLLTVAAAPSHLCIRRQKFPLKLRSQNCFQLKKEVVFLLELRALCWTR